MTCLSRYRVARNIPTSKVFILTHSPHTDTIEYCYAPLSSSTRQRTGPAAWSPMPEVADTRSLADISRSSLEEENRPPRSYHRSAKENALRRVLFSLAPLRSIEPEFMPAFQVASPTMSLFDTGDREISRFITEATFQAFNPARV